jgi:hypothetical protein
MRLIIPGILLASSVACAHAPKHGTTSGQNDEIVARGIWYATRVLEPAAAYEIHTPSEIVAKRVLPLVARYSNLVIAGPGLLRRPGDSSPSVVRITIDALEWVSAKQVVLRFSFATEESPATACAVGIMQDHGRPDSWAFRPMGEEHCWPRPSRKAPVEGATAPSNKGMKQTSVEHIGRSQLIPSVELNRFAVEVRGSSI